MIPGRPNRLHPRKAVFHAHNAARRFGKDHSGTIAVLFALTLIPVIALAGTAIDYANAYRMRAKLQFALDAATHTVGRQIGVGAETGAARQAGKEALDANLGPGFPTDYTASFTIDGPMVTGTASLTTQTFLLGIIGQNQLEIGTKSVAYASK